MEKELHRLRGFSSVMVMMSSLERGDSDLSERSFGRWGQSRVFLQAVNVFLHGECFFTFPPRVAGSSLQVVYLTHDSWSITGSTLTWGQVLCPGSLEVRSAGCFGGPLRWREDWSSPTSIFWHWTFSWIYVHCPSQTSPLATLSSPRLCRNPVTALKGGKGWWVILTTNRNALWRTGSGETGFLPVL